MGLAIPNKEMEEHLTTDIGEGVVLGSNAWDWIFCVVGGGLVVSGTDCYCGGIRLVMGFGIGHPQLSNGTKQNNRHSGGVGQGTSTKYIHHYNIFVIFAQLFGLLKVYPIRCYKKSKKCLHNHLKIICID